MNNNLLVKILDNQRNGIIILNREKEIQYANKVIRKLLGNNINKRFGEYTNCKNISNTEQRCQETIKCTRCRVNRAIDELLIDKISKVLNNFKLELNGKEQSVSMNLSLYEEEYILVEIFEIFSREYEINTLLYLSESTEDFIFFKDTELKYTYINKKYSEFFNRDKKEIIGKTDAELVKEKLFTYEFYSQCRKGDEIALSTGYYYGTEAYDDIYLRVSKEFVDGGLICNARDITDEVKARKNANLDELTGLYNRNRLKERISEVYNEIESEYYLILIDLDNLRELNNEYGHIKGDEYLRVLGQVIREKMNKDFFRIGGDEFIGLIKFGEHDIDYFLKDIFNRLKALELTPKLEISAGVVRYNKNEDYEYNYDMADKAMYEVKKQGKNNYNIKG